MAGTGPAPNPNSRRSTGSQAHTWTELPAGGFAGEIPKWPLIRPTTRERTIWARIWRTPQAEAWARLGWVHDVGMYVRCLVLGEKGSLDHVKEARMWSDRLGLNPNAMLKNRWRIRTDDLAEVRTAAAASSGESKPKRALKVAE